VYKAIDKSLFSSHVASAAIFNIEDNFTPFSCRRDSKLVAIKVIEDQSENVEVKHLTNTPKEDHASICCVF